MLDEDKDLVPDVFAKKEEWTKWRADVKDYIETLENELGRKAIRNELPLQPGDVPDTWADCSELAADFGYAPATTVEVGIKRFVEWYREYYD